MLSPAGSEAPHCERRRTNQQDGKEKHSPRELQMGLLRDEGLVRHVQGGFWQRRMRDSRKQRDEKETQVKKPLES